MKKIIGIVLSVMLVAGVSGCKKSDTAAKQSPADKYIEFGGECWAVDKTQPMFPLEKNIDQKLPADQLKQLNDMVAESFDGVAPAEKADEKITAARNFLFTSSFVYPAGDDESPEKGGLNDPVGVSKLVSNVYRKSFDYYFNKMKEGAEKSKTDIKSQIDGTMNGFRRDIKSAIAQCDAAGREMSVRELKLIYYFLQQPGAFADDVAQTVKTLTDEVKIPAAEARAFVSEILWLLASSYSCGTEMLTTLQSNESFQKANDKMRGKNIQ